MPDIPALPSESRLDARAARSRQQILSAFRTLVLSEPWEALSARTIAARAGVSRSTFYAHFTGREALFAASLAGPMGVLADTVGRATTRKRCAHCSSTSGATAPQRACSLAGG